ncbi:MAG: hypothetical protein LUQ38_02880 [Methanotrichaceae archaeon]|nr:hypothetical protein [Methanotrichaceae archaeon]
MARPEYRGSTIELRAYSPKEKAEFDAWASRHGKPTSTFLIDKLREMMDAEAHKKPARPNREHELQAKIATLEQDLRLTKMALDKAKLHISLTTPPSGVVHKLDSRMVSIIEDQKTVNEEGLLRLLNIDEGEKELIILVRRELEALEGFGLIRKTQKGWKWVK